MSYPNSYYIKHIVSTFLSSQTLHTEITYGNDNIIVSER